MLEELLFTVIFVAISITLVWMLFIAIELLKEWTK